MEKPSKTSSFHTLDTIAKLDKISGKFCKFHLHSRGNIIFKGFPGGSVVKNLSEIQETRVQLLGQEDPLEKGMTTHSCILAWRMPWTEEPGGLQTMEL